MGALVVVVVEQLVRLAHAPRPDSGKENGRRSPAARWQRDANAIGAPTSRIEILNSKRAAANRSQVGQFADWERKVRCEAHAFQIAAYVRPKESNKLRKKRSRASRRLSASAGGNSNTAF